MATPEVPINPATLVWARKTASATVEQAAKKAAVDVSRLEAWESGAEAPTVSQLRLLAELYKRPLAFFLLDQVPRDFTVLKSFRRLPESEDLDLSFQLATQLRQALMRREIALDLLADLGEQPAPFSLRATLSDMPGDVATKVRAALEVEDSAQLRWATEHEAFRRWRGAVESLDVLTFQTSRVTTDEMRGLSVFQKALPVILLNAGDAVRGRIFTLAHELAHLLLHTGAIRDSNARLSDPNEEEEVWCNEFAGALLVPERLLAWLPDETDPSSFDWGELGSQANRLKVSREVVLRRFLSVGALTRKEFQALREELIRRTPIASNKGGPIPQDVKVVSRLGVPFVRTVVLAYRQHKITLNDVSDYLDVRLKYVPKIEERVFGGGYEGEGADA